MAARIEEPADLDLGEDLRREAAAWLMPRRSDMSRGTIFGTRPRRRAVPSVDAMTWSRRRKILAVAAAAFMVVLYVVMLAWLFEFDIKESIMVALITFLLKFFAGVVIFSLIMGFG